MMLGPVMTLVNGPTIAEAIADPANELAKLVAAEPDDAKVVDEIFLRALSRPATQAEIETGVAALHASGGEQAKLMEQQAARETQLVASQSEWEAGQAPAVWTAVEPADLKASSGATFAKQPDQSVLVEGANGKTTYTVTLSTEMPAVTALRLEVLADPKLPANGPGRAPNGNLTLSEIRATAASKADPAKTMPLTFGRATADFSQEGYNVANAIDGNPQSHWAISPQVGKDHAAIFEFKEDVNFAGGTTLTITLDQQYDDAHSIGRFRLAVTSGRRPIGPSAAPQNIQSILAIAPAARSDAQRAEIAAYHRSLDPQWVGLKQALATTAEQQRNERLTGAQDLTWALINSPSFLFNR
jgi:hypothetical protein